MDESLLNDKQITISSVKSYYEKAINHNSISNDIRVFIITIRFDFAADWSIHIFIYLFFKTFSLCLNFIWN